MKRFISILALGAAIAAPSLAKAQSQSECARSNSASNTQGTLLGAAGGALAGSALAGRHDRGLGAILGAVGGGILGNRVADARNDPCYREPAPYNAYAASPPPPVRYVPPPVYDAPPVAYGRQFSVSQRIRFLGGRIRESVDEGRVSDDEAARAYGELDGIRDLSRRLTDRDGGELYGQDEQYLQSRLDQLSDHLREDRDD